MKCYKKFTVIALMGLIIGVVGCNPQIPKFLGKHNVIPNEYLELNQATQIEYPDTETEMLDEVKGAQAPLTINNSEGKQIVDISLEEAIRCGMYNSTIIRNLGGVSYGQAGAAGAPSSLTQNPNSASSIYNPAITETDGRYGVESVLADFDTLWTTTLYYQGGKSYQNQSMAYGVINGRSGNFETQLQKTNVTGGTWTAKFTGSYDWSNSSTRQFRGLFNTGVEIEMRQPLLRGAGTQFNRIAGPGAIPGFYNGVVIARLRTDIALVDFEAGVRNLVADIERAYWELYFAYRRLDSVVIGRDSALQTWRQAQAKYEAGMKGGSAQERAQAQQQYFQFKGGVESALNSLYKAEANLRYIIGLTSADGRLFRPADEPSVAKAVFDWVEVQTEAMARNIELRRQKWTVKQSELEFLASKNFLLPRLDLVARGGVNGVGENLLDPSNTYWNAVGNMANDGQWSGLIGAELSMPIGFRRERSAVRNAELVLTRNRALLQEQELEVTHKLAYSIRELEDNYVLSQTYFNRRIAAQTEVEATTAAYETGTLTLNIVLDAQRRLAEAEIDFYRSVIDYNLAILDVHTNKGSLLEYNGVFLTEGRWADKAYFDAERRAKMREKSLYINYGFTRPNVFTQGAYRQHTGTAYLDGMGMTPGQLQVMKQRGILEMDAAGNNTGKNTNDVQMVPMQGAVPMTSNVPALNPGEIILSDEPVASPGVMTSPKHAPRVPSVLKNDTAGGMEIIPTPPARTAAGPSGNVSSTGSAQGVMLAGNVLKPEGNVPPQTSERTFLKLKSKKNADNSVRLVTHVE